MTKIKQTDEEFFKSIGIEIDGSDKKKELKKDSYLPSSVALLTLTGTSIVLGFFGTLALAKKRDGASLDKALLPRRGMSESGVKLAFRALGWGTFYALSGFSIVSFGIYQFTKYRQDKINQRKLEQNN